MASENPYTILGLNTNSSLDEVKAKYKVLIVKAHPDKGGNSGAFIKIRTAYKSILDGTTCNKLPINANSSSNNHAFGCGGSFGGGGSFGSGSFGSGSFGSGSFGSGSFGGGPHSSWDDILKSMNSNGQKAPDGSFNYYIGLGKHLALYRRTDKKYVNVRTNRVITNMKKSGFVYLDVSKCGKGPFFCGTEEDMKTFCKQNNL